MMAALRILWDVARYRLARLEMANLVAAGAIIVALRTPWLEASARLAFGVLLNLLVYLNNDFHDAEEDLRAASKDAVKTRFLYEHRGAAIGAQVALTAMLAVFAAVYDLGLLVPLLAGGGICWAYSAVLKRHPVVDVLAMVVWGAVMPAVAFAPDAWLGWALVGPLALFSGAFESVQVLRDAPEDREAGIRTTGVVLGEARNWWLVRFFVVAGAVYGVACIHAQFGWLPLLALLLPRTQPERYWNLLRMVLGIAFLGACAQVFFTGGTAGLWLKLGG